MTDQYAIAIPPPLAPIKHVVISKRNLELEKRAKHARRLKRGQLQKLNRELKRLDEQLVPYDAESIAMQLTEAKELDSDLLMGIWEAGQQELQLYAQMQARGEQVDHLVSELVAQLDEIRPQVELLEKLPGIERTYDLFQRRGQIVRSLQDHQLAIRHTKEERKLTAEMRQEMEIYKAIISDRWTSLNYCHRYQKGNKTITDKVQFAEARISPDAIRFKIKASEKTMFGGFKQCLPQGVRIAEHLLSESTLRELTIACQRQVTGTITQHNGSWVTVHRLETIDGLMNYLAYRNIIDYYPHRDQQLMPIPIGVGVAHNMQWITLAEFPHGLIAGYTNSGKSNMANVILCTLIEHQSPQDLRVVLIDLKGGLEFSYYEGIPHLYNDIVDDIEGVRARLAEIEALMHLRFQQFKGVSKSYNGYRAKRPDDYMPRVLIFFDEVASIMNHGETTQAILASMREVARLGRAVGIHLWLATQRPDVKAIEGAIKINLAVRITGRMPTAVDSMTALGTGAASKLAAVPGRMILQVGPDADPVQTPHISDGDVMQAISVALTYSPPPPLDIPEMELVVHQQWTPERVVELSLTHLEGNIAADAVWKAAKDEMSQRQARELCERVWKLAEDGVEHDGVLYTVKRGKGHQRRLVPMNS